MTNESDIDILEDQEMKARLEAYFRETEMQSPEQHRQTDATVELLDHYIPTVLQLLVENESLRIQSQVNQRKIEQFTCCDSEIPSFNTTESQPSEKRRKGVLVEEGNSHAKIKHSYDKFVHQFKLK